MAEVMAEVMQGKWTLASYIFHSEAMRVSEALHDKEIRTIEASHNKEMRENDAKHNREIRDSDDRRYGEVNVEKEKALKIKETADLTALELARESQVYKDERNDAMREQSIKDNGIYATRDDLAEVVKAIGKELKPLVDYVSGQQGIVQGGELNTKRIYAAIGAVAVVIPVIVILANIFIK